MVENPHDTDLSLLDEVRFDMVESYLRDSNMPMTQLAYVAGFTDASNFARAFRQRYGVSPRKWREEHSAPSAPLRKRRRLWRKPWGEGVACRSLITDFTFSDSRGIL